MSDQVLLDVDQVLLDDGRVVRRCWAYADHVDHVAGRSRMAGSSLTRAGSTRRWRRIRAYVLDRDGWRCQLLLDDAGEVVDAPRPATPATGPDDPAWLRALCEQHNLQRGDAVADSRPTTDSGRREHVGRWEW